MASPTLPIRSVRNVGTAPKWSGILIAPELIMLISPVAVVAVSSGIKNDSHW